MKTIKQLIDLSGRRALVTGGAGHIGKAIVEGLTELGAKVAVVDQAGAYACDLKDEKATRGTAKKVIHDLGGLDVLVHCAAFVGDSKMNGWAVPFAEQSVEAWDAALRVNLTAGFVLAQECQAALTASGRGSIVLISSIYGMTGPDFRIYEGTSMQSPAGYPASKGGLLQMVRYLATAFAPKVRVNAVSPGGVERGQAASFQEKYVARTPLGRMATEEDMKGAVAFLAGDASAYITGQNIAVDGGWTAW